MELLQEILGDRSSELTQSLVGEAGFSTEQAQGFLPVAAEKLMAALQGGALDLGALLGGGDLASLLSKLNVAELAGQTGVGEEQAGAGLAALAPKFLDALKEESGGAEGLLSSLGGDQAGGLLGAAGKLAEKLFK